MFTWPLIIIRFPLILPLLLITLIPHNFVTLNVISFKSHVSPHFHFPRFPLFEYLFNALLPLLDPLFLPSLSFYTLSPPLIFPFPSFPRLHPPPSPCYFSLLPFPLSSSSLYYFTPGYLPSLSPLPSPLFSSPSPISLHFMTTYPIQRSLPSPLFPYPLFYLPSFPSPLQVPAKFSPSPFFPFLSLPFVILHIVTPLTFPSEYLSHGPCLRDVSDDWGKCQHHYKGLVWLQHRLPNITEATRDHNICWWVYGSDVCVYLLFVPLSTPFC